MPVVGVHDVGHPGRVGIVGRQVGGHPTQQCEAPQVVGPFAAVAGLVGAAAAPVQVRRVDHVHRQMAAGHAAQQQTDPQGAEAGPDVDHGAGGLHRIQDRRQAGQQQPHVGPRFGQRRRQGGHHIGQATGLDQRVDLGRHVQHLHAHA